MDRTSKNNTQPNWIIRVTIKTLPWLLLVHNLSYIIFASSLAASNSALAASNFIGIAYLISIRWALNRGLV